MANNETPTQGGGKGAATPTPNAAKGAVTAPEGQQTPLEHGFRAGTIKARAVAMYAAEGGATVNEVKAALGSVQLNVLKELEGRGWRVDRRQERVEGKRPQTRYFLSPPTPKKK